MKTALLVNHILITLFGISSGAYKVLGGEADIQVFAHLGMSAPVIAVFGAVQVVSAVATWVGAIRKPAALGLVACNAVASVGLLASGTVAFGVISVLFIAMAALVVRRAV